mgnify:CR=1 FL=1
MSLSRIAVVMVALPRKSTHSSLNGFAVYSKFLCCSCLAETKTFHLFYACVHFDSFHYVYSQPFLIFSQLYQICGFGTLSGGNLYTYWRIPVHFSWLLSVHFIILLTLVLLNKLMQFFHIVLALYNNGIYRQI